MLKCMHSPGMHAFEHGFQERMQRRQDSKTVRHQPMKGRGRLIRSYFVEITELRARLLL
jgi:hypothetical protein